MKLRPLRRAIVALAALSLLTAGISRAAVITKDFGSGNDITHLLVQFAGNVDSVLYTFHFNGALTGADLFIAISQADSNLTLTYSGSGSNIFYLTDVDYAGYSEPTYDPDEGSFYWTLFDSGGTEQAYNTPPDENTFPQPIPGVYNSVPSGSWNRAPVGASDRQVKSGSWDAWVFGEYDGDFNYIGVMPSVAPVPEPGTVFLFVAGGLAFLPFLRRKHA